MYKIILSIAALSILPACSSTPYAPLAKEELRKAFNAPTVDKSGLYIYRTGMFFGDGATKEISVDGKFIAKLRPKTFVYQEIQAGTHILSTKSSIGFSEISVDFKGGENYFFKQVFTPGAPLLGPATHLTQVDEIKGKEIVAKSRLVEEPMK